MKKLMIKLIEFYQTSKNENKPPTCRYLPTCSEYAKICFERFNFLKALFLTIKRILKCNPLFKQKYDPPPAKKEKVKNEYKK